MNYRYDSIPLLELTAVERCFRVNDHPMIVLKQINLRIMRGEFVAITGKSGSGKSTLLNILGCLDRPTSGQYIIDGLPVGELSSDQLAQLRRQRFGFIFQRYHLLAHLNASENIQLPAAYANVNKECRKKRAQHLLAELGLTDHSDYRPAMLSGGQQQRVSIARALINGGEVILADEPTGALDAESRDDVMSTLLGLHRRGHTVIIVTHDQNIAQKAHRIIRMQEGRIVDDQTCHVATKSPYVKAAPLGALHSSDTAIPKLAHTQTGDVFDIEARGAHSRHTIERWSNSIATGYISEALRTAWISMNTHRSRTLLTMLGISIGIAAVVIVVALGQGAQAAVIQDIESVGTDIVGLYPGRDGADDQANATHTLVEADLAILRKQFYVDSATPTVSSSRVLVSNQGRATGSVRGVDADYFRVYGIDMASGARFDAAAVQRHAQVAVIDDNTRERLFGNRDEVVGQTILIGTLPCTVIGVMAKHESLFGTPPTLSVLVPYTTAADRITGQWWFNDITLRLRDGVPNDVAEQYITKLLTVRHRVKDFFVSTSEGFVRTVERAASTLTLLVLVVAIVSLFVGGIGVMNVMLMSVLERTREIGIRLAVGARRSDIMYQFLAEASLLCLSGGLLGILLAFLVSTVFSLFVSVITVRLSTQVFTLACACSVTTGITFGFWPALNAARLDPVEALARE
ncbi:hypothetical protein WT83_28940 [Burkholderia territorii]|uniref:Pyoverdine export ATP-binding/permease protein PvdT n=1 Tax=Burkholderia territorii TaxID=1503055 RepID=A0A108E6H2_9BURK|nr:MacB family efflux pump subunit [Burkholderia territorii]KWN05593.1 hypothetical protein WT83_28940 [Burkholderia territorii]